MREIKFRAWLGKEERMYEPMRLHFVPDGKLLVEVPNWLTTWEYPEDVKLMQYTGIKDKNGKEIYEGDIVITGERFIGHVVYSVDEEDGSAEWLIDTGDYNECLTTPLKVIGNIYENPELLETK